MTSERAVATGVSTMTAMMRKSLGVSRLDTRPGRLDAWRRGLCVVPATRVVHGRGVDGCGRPLRADVVQACLPPALPRTGALGLRVRPGLRRLEHWADADAGRARCHEHHLDVPGGRSHTG